VRRRQARTAPEPAEKPRDVHPRETDPVFARRPQPRAQRPQARCSASRSSVGQALLYTRLTFDIGTLWAKSSTRLGHDPIYIAPLRGFEIRRPDAAARRLFDTVGRKNDGRRNLPTVSAGLTLAPRDLPDWRKGLPPHGPSWRLYVMAHLLRRLGGGGRVGLTAPYRRSSLWRRGAPCKLPSSTRAEPAPPACRTTTLRPPGFNSGPCQNGKGSRSGSIRRGRR